MQEESYRSWHPVDEAILSLRYEKGEQKQFKQYEIKDTCF